MAEIKDFVQKLSDVLVRQKVISSEEAASMVNDFRMSPKERFDYFLLEEGLIEKDQLLRALSDLYKLPYFDADGYFFNHDLLVLFPEEILYEYMFLPIELDGNIIAIVASEPGKEGIRDVIGDHVVYVPEFRIGLRRDIYHGINDFYHKSARELEEEEQDRETGDTGDDEDIVDILN